MTSARSTWTSFFAGQSPQILDLVARRYGQRPSGLIQTGTEVFTDLEALWFDVNCAFLGMLAEMPDKPGHVNGPITDRRQARMLATMANQEIEEMERNSEGIWRTT